MTSTFYSRAQGIILVFDVTIEESFLNLSRWIREIRDEAPDNCVVALCANKTDTDKGQWKVSKERFSQFAADEKIPVYEVSAATAANVSHVSVCASCCLLNAARECPRLLVLINVIVNVHFVDVCLCGINGDGKGGAA